MPTLWGISVGPGSPNWLTVQGLEILRATSVVACPQNRQGQPGLAYSIAQQYLQPHQRILSLHLPFIQDREQLERAWHQAGTELVTQLHQNQDVVFLSEGDVSFYSTFTYVARKVHTLDPTLTIRAIPGVCSPLAAAAQLGIPLAIGEEKIAVLPALYCVTDLPQVLAWANTVVLIKVASVFRRIWAQLSEANLLEHAALVEAIGQEQERVWPTLVTLETYQPPYFSLVIIRIPQKD